MTLPEFRYHSPDERPQLGLSHGLRLTIQTKGTYCAFLYHMGGFFAEVRYSLTESRVVAVRGFKNTSSLEPYLEQLDISELV